MDGEGTRSGGSHLESHLNQDIMEHNANKKHQKHAKLTKPQLGTFARNELSFLGTPCGVIQSISRQLIEKLGEQFKLAYVDADHSNADAPGPEDVGDWIPNSNLVYTDKISFHRLDKRTEADTYQYRQWFNEQDLVLVNGNHFKADRQIVFIDPRKFDSLRRKMDRLTGVVGFVKMEQQQEIPNFLKDHLPNWSKLPTWNIKDLSAIAKFIEEMVIKATPPVSGLVLAGGKSERMGRDKSQLNYHGLPQSTYLYQLMEKQLELSTYLSCRPDQIGSMPANHQLLVDSFSGLGPFGAILSAFRHNPNSAWLVVACDLPFVDQAGLEYLISKRDPSAVATAFHNPATGFPDPLVTLWEPKAYPILFQFLAQGYSCPRKVLINTPVNYIEIPHKHILTNVNNPEDHKKAKILLGQTK